MPQPKLRKVAITWLDLLTVLLVGVMGMSLWHLCDSRARDSSLDKEPDEVEFQERFQIPRLQRELTRAEAAWKKASNELTEQRLEQIRQAAALAAVTKTPEDYRKVVAESTITAGRIKRLIPYVQGLEIYVNRKETGLSRAKRDASGDWEEAKADFERRRNLVTLAWAAGLSTVLLIALWALLSWQSTHQPPGSLHPGPVIAAVAVLLAALFGYQAFGAPELSLAGATLLLVLLSTLLRRPSA